MVQGKDYMLDSAIKEGLVLANWPMCGDGISTII